MDTTVNSVQPVTIFPIGSQNDAQIIYNLSPTITVYVGESSSTCQPGLGLAIPPKASLIWDAGRPLYAISVNGSAVLTIVPNLGQLSSAAYEIGKDFVSSNINVNLGAKTYGPFDMTSYKDFALFFRENGNIPAGTSTRTINLCWYSDSDLSLQTVGGSYAGIASRLNLIDFETHVLFTQGGFMYLMGKVKAPFLYIEILDSTPTVANWQTMILRGFTESICETRIDRYGLETIVSGTLVSTGTVTGNGSQGWFSWSTGSVAAAGSATAYMPYSWSGPAVLGVRCVGAITGNVFTVGIRGATNVANVIDIDMPVTTALRSNDSRQAILPRGSVFLSVSNNSSAAVSATVTLTMLNGATR